MKNNDLQKLFILLALSFVFLMLGNNILSLTNPDEVFYTGTAKEMIQQKTWLVPYLFGQPQFEKPILTYWLLRVGLMFFGATGFGARFFPALFGMIGVIAVYVFCLRCLGNREKAFLCAFVLMTSGLFMGLARTVFTDMIFSIFILLSFISFFLGYTQKAAKSAGIIFFFIFAALAVLTKGPLGLFIPLLAVVIFLSSRRELGFMWCKYSAWGFLLFLLIAAPWYIFMIKNFGDSFIQEFFYNDHIRRLLEAEHKKNDTWYFYPLTTVLCFFPWSIFTVAGFVFLLRKLKEKDAPPIYSFLASWIITTLVIFQIAHSKLVSYVFPVFPALAIITGDFIHEAIVRNKRLIYFISLATLIIFILFPIGLVFAAFKYPMYVDKTGSFYLLVAAIFFVFVAGLIILVRNQRYFAYLIAFNMLTIFFCVFFSQRLFDDYVSSKAAVDYLKKNCPAGDVILSSKFFARGVRFYSERDVAVTNLGGTNFFSPHPIPFLDSDEKIEHFLNTQKVTSAVLNKGSFMDMERIARNKFKLSLLKKIGNEHIMVIQTLNRDAP